MSRSVKQDNSHAMARERARADEDRKAAEGWAAQAMRLPVWWYESIEAGSGAGFAVSGDETALDAVTFADRMAHRSLFALTSKVMNT